MTVNALTRKERDHLRYIADRDRRLEMQREWDKAHPTYHRQYYRKRCLDEINRQKKLKLLEAEIWNYQMQT